MKVKYYLTSSGRSPVEEFVLSLPNETRLEFVDAIYLKVARNLNSPIVVIYPVLDLDFMNYALEIKQDRCE